MFRSRDKFTNWIMIGTGEISGRQDSERKCLVFDEEDCTLKEAKVEGPKRVSCGFHFFDIGF